MAQQRDNAACLEAVENFLDQSLQLPISAGLQSIRSQSRIIAGDSGGALNAPDVFRQLLVEVKGWTQHLLDAEVQRIILGENGVHEGVPHLQKLLTALFIMKVKVLSCINMRKDAAEFPLTIPSNATFVHQVYLQCAHVILEGSPQLLEGTTLSDFARSVSEGIRRACFACVPWTELLQWGLEGVDVNDIAKSIVTAAPDPVPLMDAMHTGPAEPADEGAGADGGDMIRRATGGDVGDEGGRHSEASDDDVDRDENESRHEDDEDDELPSPRRPTTPPHPPLAAPMPADLYMTQTAQTAPHSVPVTPRAPIPATHAVPSWHRDRGATPPPAGTSFF